MFEHGGRFSKLVYPVERILPSLKIMFAKCVRGGGKRSWGATARQAMWCRRIPRRKPTRRYGRRGREEERADGDGGTAGQPAASAPWRSPGAALAGGASLMGLFVLAHVFPESVMLPFPKTSEFCQSLANPERNAVWSVTAAWPRMTAGRRICEK